MLAVSISELKLEVRVDGERGGEVIFTRFAIEPGSERGEVEDERATRHADARVLDLFRADVRINARDLPAL